YLGNFLTALEMAGVSLTVLPVSAGTLARLDAPTSAPAWTASAGRPRERPPQASPPAPRTPSESQRTGFETGAGMALGAAIRRVAEALIAAEPSLTASDAAVGDGDLGISLSRGARAILEALPGLPLDNPSATALSLSWFLEHSLGGTSGPLYA